MGDNVKKVENVDLAGHLFQIHAMADTIENMLDEDGEIRKDTLNEISIPLLTLAQVIKEKAEYCLRETGAL